MHFPIIEYLYYKLSDLFGILSKNNPCNQEKFDFIINFERSDYLNKFEDPNIQKVRET